MQLFLIGAGHVGLVTATGLARLGHRVTVADIDADRIDGLRRGIAPVFEPGLEEALAACAEADRLVFTADLGPPAGHDVSIVTVSTPMGPDGPLSTANVEQVVASLLAATGAGHTIVVRSTLPVDGPARLAALREASAEPNTSAAIVTNPEFMREGTALHDFEHPNRLVIGWLEERDRPAADRVLGLYHGIDAPTLVADARSVALVKLATNVFLATKVAYANELARICDEVGADVDIVADGIGLDPRIGRAFLTAGPGYGGSCLPEQAVALSRITAAHGVPTPLIDAVSHSNETHQRAIVGHVAGLLGGSLQRRRIALLGLAFKANTDDVRESPALSLAAYLREAGADVVGTDPRAVAKARRLDPALLTAASVGEAVQGADAVLVATEWPEYAALDWAVLATRMTGDLVYDTRDVVPREAVNAAGLRYVCLGRS